MEVKKSFFLEMLPYAAMVTVECMDVGLTTLSKAAMSKGMSHFTFVVYSNSLASLILLPSLFIFNNNRPPITFSLLSKFFLLSLFGLTITQNCVFTGISYSSPTLASALSNLVPAFTFLLAVIFRMEKLEWTSTKSQVKIIGTLVSILGALIVTLYKGPKISFSSTTLSATDNWVLGGIFLSIAGLSISICNIFQAQILQGYPSELTVVAFYCFFGTLQSAVIALIAERNLNAWILNVDVEFISVVYSGVCGSVITYSVAAWCIRKKGPVFVAMFKPLSIAIAAFLGFIFLGDAIHIGSVVGAVVIVAGFYGVMWAQTKEQRNLEIDSLQASSQKKSLLDNHI